MSRLSDRMNSSRRPVDSPLAWWCWVVVVLGFAFYLGVMGILLRTLVEGCKTP